MARKKAVRATKVLIEDALRDIDPTKFQEKMTMGDFIRLLQMWKEQGGGTRQPKEIKVRWVDASEDDE